jgi:hypothetical protein
VKVNLGPADVSFELWHDGVKLSKENSIKVEWQAAAPPTPSASDVATDFPINSLPAIGVSNGINRFSTTNLLGRKPVQSSMNMGANGYRSEYEHKSVVQTHVTPVHQNGSQIW